MLANATFSNAPKATKPRRVAPPVNIASRVNLSRGGSGGSMMMGSANATPSHGMNATSRAKTTGVQFTHTHPAAW